MLDEHHKAKLQAWIAQRLGTDDLLVEAVQPLGGGSIQENWRIRCIMDHGRKTRDFVLRKDAPATIASSRPRSEEFAILSAADRAGVCVPDPQPALAEVRALRTTLDGLQAVRPSTEWGLRWAEHHAPPCPAPTLVHRDFRTGNYMVDAHGLAAVLDWEFSGWGDPRADIGWLCAECWRFGRTDLEAGGIAPRAAFYRGYETESGARIDDDAVRYWEVVAHLRWIVVALEQGHRHLSGLEPSLELALTGRIVPELELAVLRATGPDHWSQ